MCACNCAPATGALPASTIEHLGRCQTTQTGAQLGRVGPAQVKTEVAKNTALTRENLKAAIRGALRRLQKAAGIVPGFCHAPTCVNANSCGRLEHSVASPSIRSLRLLSPARGRRIEATSARGVGTETALRPDLVSRGWREQHPPGRVLIIHDITKQESIKQAEIN